MASNTPHHMAIRRKYRRRLEVDGRQFLWCVRQVQPEDWPGFTLIVTTEEKRFLVHYYLGQAEQARHLTVIGPEFAGASVARRGYRGVRCPEWQRTASLQPVDVVRLIRWCLDPERPLIDVDW